MVQKEGKSAHREPILAFLPTDRLLWHRLTDFSYSLSRLDFVHSVRKKG